MHILNRKSVDVNQSRDYLLSGGQDWSSMRTPRIYKLRLLRMGYTEPELAISCNQARLSVKGLEPEPNHITLDL